MEFNRVREELTVEEDLSFAVILLLISFEKKSLRSFKQLSSEVKIVTSQQLA